MRSTLRHISDESINRILQGDRITIILQLTEKQREQEKSEIERKISQSSRPVAWTQVTIESIAAMAREIGNSRTCLGESAWSDAVTGLTRSWEILV
ncbi:hypothetical protein ElyMa_001724000 [Elysia marginata]|uniref:Uncharacterized protein n=1 Tax=Elysia marginata TaxID=1093978 RepID=A0AAV4JWF6_9GAST|nr:hypothetical protein ElyMa_001724000 [Elysia marginata]